MKKNGFSNNGYTMRPAQMEDIDAVVFMLNSCSQEEIGKDEWK